ncbi:hypothetical protein PMIT1312_01022 [Prochlorococcus marinus str. MIT 1312]|nr:hypothetical protein PMIT1312_01022 [Prochlorococcus marinus str. MIT 1312]
MPMFDADNPTRCCMNVSLLSKESSLQMLNGKESINIQTAADEMLASCFTLQKTIKILQAST